jgi:uncharacterized membrane protein YoaK (UPF0700 family)
LHARLFPKIGEPQSEVRRFALLPILAMLVGVLFAAIQYRDSRQAR